MRHGAKPVRFFARTLADLMAFLGLARISLIGNSAAGALAIDATVSRDQSTAAISTAAGNQLLLAFVATDYMSGPNTNRNRRIGCRIELGFGSSHERAERHLRNLACVRDFDAYQHDCDGNALSKCLLFACGNVVCRGRYDRNQRIRSDWSHRNCELQARSAFGQSDHNP